MLKTLEHLSVKTSKLIRILASSDHYNDENFLLLDGTVINISVKRTIHFYCSNFIIYQIE